MANNIEVEIRGLLSEEEYKQALNFLDQNALNKEIDDRKTTFFIMEGKTLKITEKLGLNKAKISLKTGDIVKDISQTEYEIEIKPSEFETAEKIFFNLGFDQIKHTEQKRINYLYKDVEFALKWSVDWGYHFEMEKMVSSEDKTEKAKNELLNLAQEMNFKVMSDEEFGRRCVEIDAKYNPKN